MDEMKIRSKFIKAAISKYIKKAIKKKIGCELEVELGDIIFTMDDKKANIDLSVHAEANKEEVKKIIETLL